MNQDNGGIIGKINTPTTSLASGVWSLDSQFDSQSSSIWPLAFPNTTIANACRFDDGSSDYLDRTPSGSGNQRTFTISFWAKRSSTGQVWLFQQGADAGTDTTYIGFTSTNQFWVEDYNSGDQISLKTNRLIRDLTAWYNFIIAVDTTQSTASNRVKIYINGTQETSFATETYPSENYDTEINGTDKLTIGRRVNDGGSPALYYDGYLTEVIIVDGQQLDPTSFGAFNPVTNIWEPVAYAGTYGTNGFRLDFADSSALGNDVSGNDNDFTVGNLTSVDQSTDTCSNNFATLDALASITDAPTFSDGNLTIDIPNNGSFGAQSTIGVSSGKWYAEFKLVATSDNDMAVGVNSDGDAPRSDLGPGFGTHSTGYRETGTLAVNGTDDVSYGNSYAVNDIVGIALDLDNNKLYFSKNGVFQNSGDPTSGSTGTGALSLTAASSTQSGAYFFNPGCHSNSQNGDWSANFGSPPYAISSGNADANGHGNFEYAVPSGYFALCTKNLAEFGG